MGPVRASLQLVLGHAIAHILLACFHRRNMKESARQRFTLIAVARQILLGIASVAARDVAWLHARANAPRAP